MGYDGLEKYMDLVFTLLRIVHPYIMADALPEAVRNYLKAVKGANMNPPSCLKASLHERNLSNFGNAVVAWKSEARTILSDANSQLDIRAFPNINHHDVLRPAQHVNATSAARISPRTKLFYPN